MTVLSHNRFSYLVPDDSSSTKNMAATTTTKNSMLTGLENGHFILGLFGSNVSSGVSVTTIPERWDNSWAHNLALAKLLDDAGLEFLLPVARWIGYGGQTNFEGNILESTTWAAGLAAHTRRLNLIVTVHAAVHNPVVVAKQIATIDAISGGRVGLNIVAGWNKPEFAALGVDFAAHEERYAYAQEWVDIVKKLWTSEESFDWDGRYWQLKNVRGEPRPSRPAPIINAGGSGAGRAFAVRNADMLFSAHIEELARAKAEFEGLKAAGREVGREVGVIVHAHVVCRATEEEAQAFFKYYCTDNADWEQVDRMVELVFANSKGLPPEARARIRTTMAAGHYGYLLVGTPRQVADVSCPSKVSFLELFMLKS